MGTANQPELDLEFDIEISSCWKENNDFPHVCMLYGEQAI